MNNIFNWKRFRNVVIKDFRNLLPTYGITMLILAALPVAVWLLRVVFQSPTVASPDTRLAVIELLAVVAAIMAPSRLYRTWNLRGEGIYFAMLPASKVEKYLSALLYTVVLCPLIVLAGGIALDMLLTALPFGSYHEWIWQQEPTMSQLHNGVTYNGEAIEYRYVAIGLWGMAILIAGYLATCMLFLWTSTLFQRHKVIKTLLWIMLVFFLFTVIVVPIASIAFADRLASLDWGADHPVRFTLTAILLTNLAFTALFGWLSWRRLNRMAY